MSRLARKHLALGVLLLELPPGDDLRGQELEVGSGQLAYDGLPRELLPPALRLPVIHHEIRVA